jgi:hypothetical protein
VLKLLRQNVTENIDKVFAKPKASNKTKKKQSAPTTHVDRIRLEALDWETDDVSHTHSVDLVVACDCIYNESLIEPLNGTCAALCRLRSQDDMPTLCLIAQQLRSHDVFEAWLKSFDEKFHVWQVPDDMLGQGLKQGGGFIVHIGILR